MQKETLFKKKQELEENKIQIVTSQTLLNEEKLALTTSQSEYDQKKNLYYQKRANSLSKIKQYSSFFSNLSAEEKRAEEQQEAIMRVLLSQTEVGAGVYLIAGTFIGMEGNTGYSTGQHLHFAVMQGNEYKNPCDYLPYNVYPGNGDDNCDHRGNGTLLVPLSPQGRLTSGFRPWYRPGHNAIDIASGSSTGTVSAAHNGYVYFGFEPCSGSYCNYGGAIFAKVCQNQYCNGGLKTMYWHLKCTAEPKGTSWRSCNK
jgi:hypothetical protein